MAERSTWNTCPNAILAGRLHPALSLPHLAQRHHPHLNTEATCDWNDGEWTVPLNLMAGQIVKFGHQPVQFQLGGRWYADSPPGGPEWGIRFAIVFLFPR